MTESHRTPFDELYDKVEGVEVKRLMGEAINKDKSAADVRRDFLFARVEGSDSYDKQTADDFKKKIKEAQAKEAQELEAKKNQAPGNVFENLWGGLAGAVGDVLSAVSAEPERWGRAIEKNTQTETKQQKVTKTVEERTQLLGAKVAAEQEKMRDNQELKPLLSLSRTSSSSDGSSISDVNSTSGSIVSRGTIESGVSALYRLTDQKRKTEGPQNGPLASPPPPSESESSSKKNKEARTTNCFAGLKKSFSYFGSCLINPLTFERNTSKNFQEDVKTGYKKENNKNPEVKRQDGATKESQTSSSSASFFGSLRERFSNAWRAGVDIKVGVTVTSNGRSREYSTKSKLTPPSKYELKERAISAANTVIGAAGSSCQTMRNAKEDTLGTAKELAGLLSDSNNTVPLSTSFRDLGASAARAMGSLSKTNIPSPDLPTVREIRESLPSLPSVREMGSLAASTKASLPKPPSLRDLGASAASAKNSLSENISIPSPPSFKEIQSFAASAKASIPSFPSTKGMKELAASLRPAEGTLGRMRVSLPSPSMPTLPSLPSSIMPVLKISSGR